MTDHADTSSSALLGPGFVWGAATSSFQIEGAADADGKGESIWDRFCTVPGAIADGSDGITACDHYHRVDDDVALMRWLGLDSYRFSVAWPRVVPDGDGAVNPAGLDFYDRLVDTLLEAGITPAPTLYHWDLPQALEERGGWRERSTAEAFARYAQVTAERLGDRVDTWFTLNEPFVSTHHGHCLGVHAPGRQSLPEALAVAHHLLLAHGLAVPVLRAAAPRAEVGVVLNFTPILPTPEAGTAAAVVDAWENRWYVEPLAGLGYPAEGVAGLEWDQAEIRPGDLELIAAPVDVLGINYYTCQRLAADGTVLDPEGPVTDFGWEIIPRGLGDLLIGLHDRHRFRRYLITENGAAMPDDRTRPDGTVDDADRIDYLSGHLAEVARARQAGVPVDGYYAWSLMDNFEWAEGYRKTFGLVAIDPAGLERKPKASAHWYRDRVLSEKLGGKEERHG